MEVGRRKEPANRLTLAPPLPGIFSSWEFEENGKKWEAPLGII